MNKFKIIMITFILCFGFYLHSDVMQAHESVGYTAHITLIVKKADAMGHNLGNVTFKNNGVTMYEYIAV